MAKQPLGLSELLGEHAAGVETSATSSENKLQSAQVSVRLDGTRYAKLKKAGIAFEMTHKDILIEGFDLWLKEKGL